MRAVIAILLSLLAGSAFAQQTSPFTIVKGGTGASTASGARTNLGVTATGGDATYAFRANNLSDLANAGTARTNLGLVIGTNVEAWNALLDCFSGLGTTGILRRTGAGTCSAATAVANSELATMTANTIKGNATGSTAAPTDVAMPSCSGANQAVNWTSGTGPGCVTISGSGGGVVGPQSPQIRLTLTQGTPVTTADVTAATSLYLEPYNGTQLAIYDGVSSWVSLTVAASTYSLPATQSQTCTTNATITVTGCTDTSQMTIGEQVTGTGITGTGTIATIPSSTSFTLASAASGSGTNSLTFKLPPSTNYDIYAINNGGVPKLVPSAAWSNDTTPPTRVLQDGVEVASGATTKRLLGSIRTTTVAGQIADTHTTRWLSNRYNEQPRPMYTTEPTASWGNFVSASFAWRQNNSNTSNQLDYIACVPRPIWVQAQGAGVAASTNTNIAMGVGIDTITSSTAQLSQQMAMTGGANSQQGFAIYTGTPGLGRHVAAWLESSSTAATATMIGTSTPNTQVSGIFGEIAN